VRLKKRPINGSYRCELTTSSKLLKKSGNIVQGRGTGWTIWDGAVVTANFLDRACSDSITRLPATPAALCPAPTDVLVSPEFALNQLAWLSSVTDCIELGSGTGLAGLAAAAALQVWTVTTLTSLSHVYLEYTTH
jgi:hypothetical protein